MSAPPCRFCKTPLTSFAEMKTADGTSVAAECPVCGTYVIPEASFARYDSMDMMTRYQVMAKVESEWKRTGEPVTVTPDFF